MTPDEIKELLSPTILNCTQCKLIITGDNFVREHNEKHEKERQFAEMAQKAKTQRAREQVKTLKELLEANLK